MSKTKEQIAEETMAGLHSSASKILAAPPEYREKLIRNWRDGIAEAAEKMGGQSPAEAAKTADTLEGFLRGLIGLIVNSGGGQGGSA